MRVDQAARSHIGRVRQRNEDAWCCWPRREAGEMEGPVLLFGVADGMGGHPGGDVASSLAVSVLADARPSEWDAPRSRLREIFRRAHERIAEAAARNPELQQMGTTLTVACLCGVAGWAGQIGDSRLYWIRGTKAWQITRDHTLAQELIESGTLSPRDAEEHYSSHVLTRCLGVCPEHEPDLLGRPLRLEVGDWLLLASDGLVKAVRTETLPELLRASTASVAVENIESAALRGGAPDNVTVIAVRVLDPGEGGPPDSVGFGEPNRLDWTQE